MNTNEILALYDEQERKNGTHPSYRREETPTVVRNISHRRERLSFIIYSRLTAANADQVIQEEVAYFKSLGGRGMEWKVYDHDTPPDLKERLQAHGFVPDEAEPLLIMDLENAPAVFLQPVTADVRPITEPEQLQDVISVQEQVWGGDFGWLKTQLIENMAAQPDFWRIYVAYVNDEPACAAWIAYPPGSQFASLWGGSTVAKYRQHGLYTAVVATRAQEALRRGYRFLTVDASPMSRPILEKRGFQLLTYSYPYTWNNPSFQEKDA